MRACSPCLRRAPCCSGRRRQIRSRRGRGVPRRRRTARRPPFRARAPSKRPATCPPPSPNPSPGNVKRMPGRGISNRKLEFEHAPLLKCAIGEGLDSAPCATISGLPQSELRNANQRLLTKPNQIIHYSPARYALSDDGKQTMIVVSPIGPTLMVSMLFRAHRCAPSFKARRCKVWCGFNRTNSQHTPAARKCSETRSSSPSGCR